MKNNVITWPFSKFGWFHLGIIKFGFYVKLIFQLFNVCVCGTI